MVFYEFRDKLYICSRICFCMGKKNKKARENRIGVSGTPVVVEKAGNEELTCNENNNAEETEAKVLEKIDPVKAIFTGDSIFSNTKEAMDLYGKSRFGEVVEGKVYYSFVEALFLVERAKMEISYKSRNIGFDKFIGRIQDIDEKIHTKFVVFRDMRNRGFIVKTALKFGAEFRVYNRGVFPGKDHARWILYPVHESETLTWHDFAAKNRVAHSTRKNLLIGIVDEEGDVTYYECTWIRP